MQTPFSSSTTAPFVALVGKRAGYVQVAPNRNITQHAAVPLALFDACQAWSAFLQSQEQVAKVYWVQFSEVVEQLHWHLYPRFSQDALKGTQAFEARNDPSAAVSWELHWQAALWQWAKRYDIAVLDPEGVLTDASVLFPDYSPVIAE
jgi:hypothetical protein